ncbi:MAG: hypothetical protein AABX03_01365 [Nanoarchaeota archaeon]
MNKLAYVKRGNILSVWWFVVLAIIGLGIVLGVLLFYSAYINVKSVESDVLTNKISLCFSANQKEINSINFLDNFSFFDKCNLNSEVFSKGSLYFVKIIVSDISNGEKKEYRYGTNSLEKDCEVEKGVLNAPKFPGCSTKELTINGKLKISIITASNNDGEVPRNG